MMTGWSARWFRQALIVAVAAMVLYPFGGETAVTDSHGEQTITGEVWGEEYDDDGKATSVSIYDQTWGTVLVSPSGRGRELLKHVGALVEVTGEIHDSEDGGYVIDVGRFRILSDMEEGSGSYNES